jgi:hypothetical protein
MRLRRRPNRGFHVGLHHAMNPQASSPSHHARAAHGQLVSDIRGDVQGRLQPPPGTSAAPSLFTLLNSRDMIDLMIRGALDMAVDQFGGTLESLVAGQRDVVRRWASDKVVDELSKLTGLLRSPA